MSEEIKIMKVSYAELQNKLMECNSDRIRLQQENRQLNQQLKEYKRLGYKHLQEKNNKLESILDEIRDRATIRLARLENESDYCKWFLEGYDRAITVNRVSNSGVAMEWVKNTMITECEDLLQILDKAVKE